MHHPLSRRISKQITTELCDDETRVIKHVVACALTCIVQLWRPFASVAGRRRAFQNNGLRRMQCPALCTTGLHCSSRAFHYDENYATSACVITTQESLVIARVYKRMHVRDSRWRAVLKLHTCAQFEFLNHEKQKNIAYTHAIYIVEKSMRS